VGPGFSGAERAAVAASGAGRAAKAAIRAKAERPRVKRVVSLRRMDGVMGNLLRMRCYLIITAVGVGSIPSWRLGGMASRRRARRLLDGKSVFL
jgi:hypothetical protein